MSLIQSMALSALPIGLRSLSPATLYRPVRSYVYGFTDNQTKVQHPDDGFLIVIFDLPTLVSLVAIAAQFFAE